ncbi:MAG TPA: hypothetical protein V6D48_06095 [Oculatellaceae cyanobacterium]
MRADSVLLPAVVFKSAICVSPDLNDEQLRWSAIAMGVAAPMGFLYFLESDRFFWSAIVPQSAALSSSPD